MLQFCSPVLNSKKKGKSYIPKKGKVEAAPPESFLFAGLGKYSLSWFLWIPFLGYEVTPWSAYAKFRAVVLSG